MKRLFVTGTDTGVGKTRVTAALAAAWSKSRRVAVMKPIETGCRREGNRLVAEDAATLAAACGRELDPALVCPFRYQAPASPESAAALDGAAPASVVAIQAAFVELTRGADVALVEGAGGLLVPIAPAVTMADLAAALEGALLIVARTRLGTLNHTLLTIEVARRRGLRIAGVVLNRTEPVSGPEEERVAALVAAHGEVAVLGVLPYAVEPASTFPALAAWARDHLSLDGLWDRL